MFCRICIYKLWRSEDSFGSEFSFPPTFRSVCPACQQAHHYQVGHLCGGYRFAPLHLVPLKDGFWNEAQAARVVWHVFSPVEHSERSVLLVSSGYLQMTCVLLPIEFGYRCARNNGALANVSLGAWGGRAFSFGPSWFLWSCFIVSRMFITQPFC